MGLLPNPGAEALAPQRARRVEAVVARGARAHGVRPAQEGERGQPGVASECAAEHHGQLAGGGVPVRVGRGPELAGAAAAEEEQLAAGGRGREGGAD